MFDCMQNQLRTSNSSLGESQREIEKLQSQLKRQNESTESDIGLLNKQHAKVVKGLQNKVVSTMLYDISEPSTVFYRLKASRKRLPH